MLDYPNDADGDALRRIAGGGSDMSKPMRVDFQMLVPTPDHAERLVVRLRKLGYSAHVYEWQLAEWEPGRDLTCEAFVRTLATYDVVIAIQNELELVCEPFGGVIDGWGSFGNIDESK
ncbi:MAG: ribonuclease E inhibitor RraB [Phycisphaerales bacterium]